MIIAYRRIEGNYNLEGSDALLVVDYSIPED